MPCYIRAGIHDSSGTLGQRSLLPRFTKPGISTNPSQKPCYFSKKVW
jgi:hypothetical protein